MKVGFVLSLPRSGSTFVQRVLSRAPGVATSSEPWLVPALLGIRSGAPQLADFAHDHTRAGLTDFVQSHAQGETAWREGVREMVTRMYGTFDPLADIFIDKTPRNHCFSNEIMDVFDDSPVLILWRNPLAVVHSMNVSWGGGRWKAYFYEFDLFGGLAALVNTATARKNDSRLLCVRYEDLISDPHEWWPRVFSHFGLAFEPSYLLALPKLQGIMGDKTGQTKYADASQASVHQWPQGFSSPWRRRWARHYLNWIGEERLEVMGYSLQQLMRDLNSAPKFSPHISDTIFMGGAGLYHLIEPFKFRRRPSPSGAPRPVARR